MTSFQTLVEQVPQRQALELAGQGDSFQAPLELAAQFQAFEASTKVWPSNQETQAIQQNLSTEFGCSSALTAVPVSAGKELCGNFTHSKLWLNPPSKAKCLRLLGRQRSSRISTAYRSKPQYAESYLSYCCNMHICNPSATNPLNTEIWKIMVLIMVNNKQTH